MIRLVILLTLCWLLPVSTVEAKRPAPVKVPPVAVGTIEYRAAGEHSDSLSSNAGLDTFDPRFRGLFFRARRLDLDQQDTDEDNDVELPDDVADAWAAVLIDVHEKIKDDGKPDQSKDTNTNET